MSIRKNFALSHDRAARDNAPNSGMGAANATPEQPMQASTLTQAVAPSAEMSSRDALAGLSREHGDHEAEFRAAADRSQGVANTQGSAGIGIGGGPDRFDTTGRVGDDTGAPVSARLEATRFAPSAMFRPTRLREWR